jgi:Fur family peroxide stress response transcriptional regulator
MKIRQQEQIEHFRRVCKANKLSLTPQRVAIYKALIASDDHPGTEDIFNLVRASFPDISMDTVYRALNTFVQLGLANLVESSGQPRRYDPVVKQHHHFHCKCCNAVIDFHDEQFNALEPPECIKQKFTVSCVKVILEGVCDKCAQNLK